MTLLEGGFPFEKQGVLKDIPMRPHCPARHTGTCCCYQKHKAMALLKSWLRIHRTLSNVIPFLFIIVLVILSEHVVRRIHAQKAPPFRFVVYPVNRWKAPKAVSTLLVPAITWVWMRPNTVTVTLVEFMWTSIEVLGDLHKHYATLFTWIIGEYLHLKLYFDLGRWVKCLIYTRIRTWGQAI